jgi:MFS family permease
MAIDSKQTDGGGVSTLVPARMDRLPWTRFHWSIVVGLGFSWVLDGLEIQIVASAGFAEEFGLTAQEVGLLGTVYLFGQIAGALIFGRLADKLGRRKLFILTLIIYLVASGLAGLSWNLWSLLVLRFVAGMGIGGEYAAINSAIDELIPSRYRGRVDIAINGTYWGGAALGSAANVFLLDTNLFAENVGWRIGFFIGPVLGLAIIYLRRHIPESPRWLMTHGRVREAEKTVDDIERRIIKEGRELGPVDPGQAMTVTASESLPFRVIAGVLFREYPKRTLVGATMMITQSFLYNAIFFTYALVLQNFYGTDPSSTQYFFFPFAIGNLLGPLLLGHLFDVWGRRRMILLTYGVAGVVSRRRPRRSCGAWRSSSPPPARPAPISRSARSSPSSCAGRPSATSSPSGRSPGRLPRCSTARSSVTVRTAARSPSVISSVPGS